MDFTRSSINSEEFKVLLKYVCIRRRDEYIHRWVNRKCSVDSISTIFVDNSWSYDAPSLYSFHLNFISIVYILALFCFWKKRLCIWRRAVLPLAPVDRWFCDYKIKLIFSHTLNRYTGECIWRIICPCVDVAIARCCFTYRESTLRRLNYNMQSFIQLHFMYNYML